MKEIDYVMATDLARLQIVGDVLRMMNSDDDFETSPIEHQTLQEMRAQVSAWRQRLEKLCQTK